MKRYFFLVFFFVLAVSPLLAQTTGITFDPAVAQLIFVTGILGFSCTALTEMLKRLLFKTDPKPKYAGYLCSALVAVAATVTYLVLAHIFTFLDLGLYSFFVWLIANGFYKALPK